MKLTTEVGDRLVIFSTEHIDYPDVTNIYVTPLRKSPWYYLRCPNVPCWNCPIDHICTDTPAVNGYKDYLRGIVLPLFPELVDTNPELFI